MTHRDVRTVEDALMLVDEKARGRTRYEGQEPYVDEMLAGEVRRLRSILNTGICMWDDGCGNFVYSREEFDPRMKCCPNWVIEIGGNGSQAAHWSEVDPLV